MPGTRAGWSERKRRLTKRDLEILAPIFGFRNASDFAEFVEEQDRKDDDRKMIETELDMIVTRSESA
ncbi:hypothetical protein GJ25_gp074 [Mycobacterium phage Hawkeye]|uniref:Uncharacterized protein n=1 Tax=Mycobacterium phage Hawkeye TaxID=1458711 RepID=X2KT46_9CAUD|nr:hypothetical protein GJ25_gp074 [Mycobacterium phage Hawkeye]AHN84085.1 hypothetical protein PBI_HAWKEYE_74 [Mycobacterium phage Hawkeye]